MIDHTPRFDGEVTAPHSPLVRVDILSGGVPVRVGIAVAPAGSVVSDRKQAVLRTCTVTVVDPSLAPVLASDPLTPFGNELFIQRGVQYPDGSVEMLPCGVFGIKDVPSVYPFQGIQVTGMDRMQRVVESGFPFARTMTGTTVVQALEVLLTEVVPWADLRVDPRIDDIPIDTITWPAGGTSRSDAVSGLATSVGGWCYVDGWGTFVLAPVPDPLAPPVMTVSGGDGGQLVSVTRDLTRTGAYNAVVATSSGGTATVTSDLVFDDNPNSPTYWFGIFGQIIFNWSSPLLSTVSQANLAAGSLLADVAGVPKSVGFTQAPNPALEPGDAVLVVFPDGTRELHIVDGITLPLDFTTVMSASTRSTVLS